MEPDQGGWPLPDIFLSYSREDQAVARRFAEGLQAQGFSVWWDTTLRAGEAYDEVTEQALSDAEAVVVLWSPRSVISRWVRAEATQADRQGTLVPVMIEPCKRPIMFELTQTAELSRWVGAADDPAWLTFVADVRRLVEKRRTASEAVSATAPRVAQVEPNAATARARSVIPSDRIGVVFLPFVDLTTPKDQAAFLDGLAEEIIALVARNPAVALVRAPAARNTNPDLPAIAEQSGARYVLDGSVRGSGARLRVTARLMSPFAGAQLWSDRFDGTTDDDFALQERVASSVAAQMEGSLAGAEVLRLQNVAPEKRTANERIALANALSFEWNRDAIERALALFSQALSLEPGLALAHAGVSWCHSVIYQSGWSHSPAETRRLALDHARGALKGAEQDVRVLRQYAASLCSLGADLTAAEAMIDRACALNPSDSTLWGIAGWLKALSGKRTDAALACIKTNLSLAPASSGLIYSILCEAICLFESKKFAEAIPLAMEACSRRPDYMLAQALLTASLAHAGRLEEARAAWADMKTQAQVDIILAMLRDPADRELLRTGLELAGRTA